MVQSENAVVEAIAATNDNSDDDDDSCPFRPVDFSKGYCRPHNSHNNKLCFSTT